MEIDGGSYKDKKRKRKDQRKDREFAEHGYSVLRFWNEKTVDKIAFLHKLYYRLLGIEGLSTESAFLKRSENNRLRWAATQAFAAAHL